MMNARNVLLAALCIATLAPMAAQAGEVRNREVRQETRIYQGTQSRQLTRGEYDRLQGSEARINDQRRNDLYRDGGHLTNAQYYHLNREESRLSSRIYVDKHNDVRPHS
jgi:hypothetical protein